MHPVLFTIRAFELFGHRFGPIEIRAYGVMLIIGVLVAAWWARSRAKAWGIEPAQVSDAIFWGVIPGVLGARIGFIVQEWGYYSQHLDKLFSVQFAGLTSFGGVVFALLGLLYYTKRAKINSWAFLDVASVPLLVTHAIGRLGCLLNGCCYGHPTTAWYGVHIDANTTMLFEPAQVVDASLVMVGVGVILLLERRKRKPGTSFAFVVIAWGIARFLYEFFRAGTEAEVKANLASSTYWDSLPITQAHAAAVVVVFIGLVLLWFANRQPDEVAECA